MSLTSFLTGTLIPALKANDSGRVQWGNVADEIARLLGADTAAAFGPYINLGVTAGSTNQYTIPGAQTPDNFDLNDGLLIGFITDRVNTSSGGSPTELKIDTLAAKKILTPSGAVLFNAELPANYFGLCSYDSSLDSGNGAFVLLTPRIRSGTFTLNLVGTGGLNVSTGTVAFAEYRLVNGFCSFGVNVSTFTTTGSASDHLKIDLPFPKKDPSNQKHIANGFYFNGSTRLYSVFPNQDADASKLQLYAQDPAGLFIYYVVASGQSLQLNGGYFIA